MLVVRLGGKRATPGETRRLRHHPIQQGCGIPTETSFPGGNNSTQFSVDDAGQGRKQTHDGMLLSIRQCYAELLCVLLLLNNMI